MVEYRYSKLSIQLVKMYQMKIIIFAVNNIRSVIIIIKLFDSKIPLETFTNINMAQDEACIVIHTKGSRRNSEIILIRRFLTAVMQ